MKQNYTDITVVIDASSSMGIIWDSTIAGFNAFLEDQKKVTGEATISQYQFNTIVNPIYVGQNIQHTAPLNKITYVPSGSTALLDTLGHAINATGERLAAMREEDRPSRVMFVVITDGQENASRTFSRDKVKDMIKHQQDVYSWEFQFLGANIDAIAEAASIGIAADKAMNYSHTDHGVTTAFLATSRNLRSYRTEADLEKARSAATFSAADKAEAIKTS